MVWRWIVGKYRDALWILRACSRWVITVFVAPTFADVAKEFFLEAAVLIAVFPALDYFVQHGTVNSTLIAWSGGLTVAFLALAGILAAKAEQRRE